MWPTIFAIVAIGIVLFFVFVATRSSALRVERSQTINAEPSVVFGMVNDLHKWNAWSPWAKLDPDMKVTHSGPAQGHGASYFWQGNKKVGEGRMTIKESQPDRQIVIHLEFLKPFAATNTTVFTFKAQGNQTLITWTMTGHKNFMMKLFGLLMNMDKMIGLDFEKGLSALKEVVESGIAQSA